mmetsp:Transcript_93760/g.148038  ORF Transcript_93760/g.148038 Transcript_93760/m.148038 type:complete len:1003 (-) Transcript_93760:279-3287(-)
MDSSPGGGGGGSSSNIKVCVRVRPFNDREKNEGTTLCVQMPSQSDVVVRNIAGLEKTFSFDRTYWSHDPRDMHCDDQSVLMNELGLELEDNCFQGYNSCLFAYGQTGSGKTYSVLGQPHPPDLRGLLPRIIDDFFRTIDKEKAKTDCTVEFSCNVTYIEIYNEEIKDLLCPTAGKLEVRSNPKVGVYIQNLKEVPVFDKKGVQDLLDFGAKARTVAATCMNDQSSRSHCIFALEMISKRTNDMGGQTQLRAKLNLVDLAGSERQTKTHASGERLKEGSSINKSLSNLALVISKLAEMSERRRESKGKDFVPFRNSKLTHCLQDSLSGNSRTVMIAALSPALSNYEETLSTLRFAASVKLIKTVSRKNEENLDALVNNLRAECERLRRQVESGKGDMQELNGVEHLIQKYGEGFETQIQKAKEMEAHRQEFLKDAGLTIEEMAKSVGIDNSVPKLVNVCTDPSLSGCLVYFLMKEEDITCGSAPSCKIVLSGLGIEPHMATIFNKDDLHLNITAEQTEKKARVLVNGARILETRELRNGDRLIFGHAFCFRVAVPLAKEDVETQEKEKGCLEHALAEVVPEQTDAYKQCRVYVEDLHSRVGSTRAQHFLMGFQKAMTLADEGNTISETIRPLDRYHFNVEVLVNTFQFQHDEPECVIRLRKYLTGVKRLKDLIQRHIISPKRLARRKSSTGAAEGLDQLVKRLHKFNRTKSGYKSARGSIGGLDSVEHEPYTTIAIWDIDSFASRMTFIREAYERCHHEPDVEFFHLPENDPWKVPEPWDLIPIFQEREQFLRENLSVSHHSAGNSLLSTPRGHLARQGDEEAARHKEEIEFYKIELEKQSIELQRCQLDSDRRQLELDRRTNLQDKLEQARLAHDQERLNWQSSDRAKDTRLSEQASRIRALERENERQRAEAAEAREQLQRLLSGSAAQSRPQSAASPAELRLRHASEESAVAAHLATKLLGSLRDIKGDLKSQLSHREVTRSESVPGARSVNFYQSRGKR